MNGLRPIALCSELAINRLLMRGLYERIADEHSIANRRAREAFADGVKVGRASALGWLFVGAASGFLAALAVGFAVFW